MPQKEGKYEVLKRVFGHTGFRPLQEKAVDAALSGKDLLLILPTGGGKSLCYQLPALLKEGVTVVISPLLALMQDQVRALKLQGIGAEMIGSMQGREEIDAVMQGLRKGEVKLLYIAPERFNAFGFTDLLRSIPVASFVVDEAHCVSEWGHEFREEYRRLHRLKELFPDTPVSAFTATATPLVEEDIARQLGLKDPVRLRGSVYRENLLIRAAPRSGDGRGQLLRFLSRFKGESGIVYTFTRNAAESLAGYLQAHDEILMVSGFTDDQRVQDGNRRFADNWELSAERALTVTRALIADGVPQNAIFAAAFGSQQPVGSNADAEGRARNRRVEIAPIPRSSTASGTTTP